MAAPRQSPPERDRALATATPLTEDLPFSCLTTSRSRGGHVPLSFRSRPVGDITVVECSGRIVEGAESARLQQHLHDLLFVNPHILLHLGAVDFIDSSGIGLLVRFHARMQYAQGNLKICAASAKINEVLRVT